MQLDGTPLRRLVTGSCDNVTRIWRNVDNTWKEESVKGLGHTGTLLNLTIYFKGLHFRESRYIS